MKSVLKIFRSMLCCGLVTASLLPLRAEDTVKVGILHSLSGTMAISETSLRDVLLFAIDEINANGGVLGFELASLRGKGEATA